MDGALTSFWRRDGRLRGWCVALMAIVLIPLLAGCYGNFMATRAIYRVNAAMPGRLLETVVMWVFVVIPVYGVGTLIDVFILNVAECIVGAPIDVARTTERDGVTYASVPAGDGRANVTVSRDGDVLLEVALVQAADGTVEIRDADGKVLGRALPTEDGGRTLTDAQGLTVATLSPEQLAAAR
jgi:hypothetical protein